MGYLRRTIIDRDYMRRREVPQYFDPFRKEWVDEVETKIDIRCNHEKLGPGIAIESYERSRAGRCIIHIAPPGPARNLISCLKCHDCGKSWKIIYD